jgi:hypothetical protein
MFLLSLFVSTGFAETRKPKSVPLPVPRPANLGNIQTIQQEPVVAKEPDQPSAAAARDQALPTNNKISPDDLKGDGPKCTAERAKSEAIGKCDINGGGSSTTHSSPLNSIVDAQKAVIESVGRGLSDGVKRELENGMRRGLESKFSMVSWMLGENAFKDKESGAELQKKLTEAKTKCSGDAAETYNKVTSGLNSIDYKKQLGLQSASDEQLAKSREVFQKRLLIAWLEVQRLDRALLTGSKDTALQSRRKKILDTYPMIAENPNPEVLRKEAALTYMGIRVEDDKKTHPEIDKIIFLKNGRYDDLKAGGQTSSENEGVVNSILNGPLNARMKRALNGVMKNSLAKNLESVGYFCKLDRCQTLGISRNVTSKKISGLPGQSAQVAHQAVCSCNLSTTTEYVSGNTQLALGGALIAGAVLCPVTGVSCYGAAIAGAALAGSSALNTVGAIQDLQRVVPVERAASALPGLSSSDREFAQKEARDAKIRFASEAAGTAMSVPAGSAKSVVGAAESLAKTGNNSTGAAVRAAAERIETSAPKVRADYRVFESAEQIGGRPLNRVTGGAEDDVYARTIRATETKHGGRAFVSDRENMGNARGYANVDENSKPFFVMPKEAVSNPKEYASTAAHETVHVSNTARLSKGQELGNKRTIGIFADGDALIKPGSYSKYMRIDEVHARAVQSGVDLKIAEDALKKGNRIETAKFANQSHAKLQELKEMQYAAARTVQYFKMVREKNHSLLKLTPYKDNVVEIEADVLQYSESAIEKIKHLRQTDPEGASSIARDLKGKLKIQLQLPPGTTPELREQKAFELLEGALEDMNRFDKTYDKNMKRLNSLYETYKAGS